MVEPTDNKDLAPHRAPTVVLIVGIVASVLLWLALARQQREYMQSAADQQAELIQREVSARMEARVLALVRLARRSGEGDAVYQPYWEDDARMVYRHYPGYQAIERVDESGKVQWAIPLEENLKAIGFDMMLVPERVAALQKARDTAGAVMTQQTALAAGHEGFLLVVPIFRNEASLGWVVGAFRTRELLAAMLASLPTERYQLSIAHGQETLYQTGEVPDASDRPVGLIRLSDYGLNWQIRAWASDKLYAAQRSALPQGVLLGGVLMSALLATSIHLGQTSRRQTRQTERLNRELGREIEQRRLAEIELQRTAERLEASNRELQDFASVASHDLQEPLRKIQAFGDRLRLKCAQPMGDEGCDYLDRIQGAARRMGTLINDLLTFSRVTTKARPFLPTDLNEVAREVLGDLETRLEQTCGTVELDALPSLDADALQMRQLLQNLISNGLKFRRPGVPPVVRISGQVIHGGVCTVNGDGKMVELSIQDNGIGFDEKYLDRIFTVFQRLHGRTEYEGTGIGLAVCRKIVERHGGCITAHSTLGEGARFIVSLPQRHHQQEEGDQS